MRPPPPPLPNRVELPEPPDPPLALSRPRPESSPTVNQTEPPLPPPRYTECPSADIEPSSSTCSALMRTTPPPRLLVFTAEPKPVGCAKSPKVSSVGRCPPAPPWLDRKSVV